MSETFTARVVRGEQQDTMGFVVPPEVVARLGKRRCPPVVVTIGAYTWRSTVASMGGELLLGIAKEHRGPAGLKGDEREVRVTLAPDTAPRTVEVPEDLAAALDSAGVRAGFDGMAPSHRKEWVRNVEEARKPETRARRVAKAVEAAREKLG